MNCQLQSNVRNEIGMEFGWHPDIHTKSFAYSQYAMSVWDEGVQPSTGDEGHVSRFADTASSLTYSDTSAQEYGLSAVPSTLYPAHLWSDSTESPDTAGRRLSTQASTPTTKTEDSTVSLSPLQSERSRRARYAANKRHSKSRKVRQDGHQNESAGEVSISAIEKKQRQCEKNKIAAAKCRSRQRKLVQAIQEKGGSLGQKNAELKSEIGELRGELNSLRDLALNHRVCNCEVAKYNCGQAERVVAEYHSSYLCSGGAAPLGLQWEFPV